MTLINLDNYRINIRGSTGALVVGKPGSGKTVLVSYLMLKLMTLGALPLICDTKRSDFFSLRKILDKSDSKNAQVAATPGQVAKMLRVLTDLMNQRYEHHQENWGWD